MRRKYTNLPILAVGGVLLLASAGGAWAGSEPDSGSEPSPPIPDFILSCDDFEIAESVVDDTPGGDQTPIEALDTYLKAYLPGLADDVGSGEADVETVDEYESGTGDPTREDGDVNEGDPDAEVGVEGHEVLVLDDGDGTVESQFWAEFVGDSWHVERHGLCLSEVEEGR